MSTEPKMTPWFVNGEQPWEPGVYNVSCRKANQTGGWWSYFNGERWGRISRVKEWAFENRALPTLFQTRGVLDGSWRGLAEKP